MDLIRNCGPDWLNEKLAADEILIMDGAMGTELEARGVPIGDNDFAPNPHRRYPGVQSIIFPAKDDRGRGNGRHDPKSLSSISKAGNQCPNGNSQSFLLKSFTAQKRRNSKYFLASYLIW